MQLEDLRRRKGYVLPLFGLAACAITMTAIFGVQQLDRWSRDGTLARFASIAAPGTGPAPVFRDIDMTPTGSIDRVRIDPCTGKPLPPG